MRSVSLFSLQNPLSKIILSPSHDDAIVNGQGRQICLLSEINSILGSIKLYFPLAHYSHFIIFGFFGSLTLIGISPLIQSLKWRSNVLAGSGDVNF
jgi:hypothetical protein